MLPMPRAKSDWLETAWRLAKICCERNAVACHSLIHVREIHRQPYCMFTSDNQSSLMVGCKCVNALTCLYSHHPCQQLCAFWHHNDQTCCATCRIDCLICSRLSFSSSTLLGLNSLCSLPSIQAHMFSMGDKSGDSADQLRKCPPGTSAAMYAMFVAVLWGLALSCCSCQLSAHCPAHHCQKPTS